ncbi:helix-turn-helix domain-containing protein [Oscillibacter sp.]|uniref:helix-turn-helix domain-containing protein n=1 Tax=Oscillibacter sp. TaxID=1945593 RepID=UPI00262D0073|nr:helix-turn-helix domain-containing protein [Oscillibacter sp.]MDD3346099.1 response regulator [Oscillibacter sp.]
MELYRVLLVDDEEDIRVGISRKMDWASLGFALVGEAENGRDALELAEALEPDVVLTDIKMPFMDGLELCRILTERLPASKFVVFSGFDEFEYAKQAIRMNVSEYILKPINATELGTVLQKLKEQLDRERTQRQNVELLRTRYEETLPVLRELYYTHLLEGRIPPGQEEERAARLDIDLSGQAWVAALVYMDASPTRELRTLSVQQLLEENLNLDGCCSKVFLYGDSVAVLTSFQNLASVYEYIGVMNRVCSLAESYLGLTITVGVGTPCTELAGLPQSAEGARSALDYRRMVGAGRAIYIGDLEPDTGARLTFDENDERELSAAVKLGGEAEVRDEVDRLMARLHASGLPLAQCGLFFLELLTCLLKLTRGANLSPEEVFGIGFTGAVQVTDFASPEALGAWCLERCLRIQSSIRRQHTDTAGKTVERAKSYISEHYGQSDLSVERLCGYLHLSAAYFSTLFKRETGMSFTAYVTVVRMDAAAELLRNTEEKTYLIAQRCGYEDPNYFSYAFKRHFGMTPTKFRAG